MRIPLPAAGNATYLHAAHRHWVDGGGRKGHRHSWGGEVNPYVRWGCRSLVHRSPMPSHVTMPMQLSRGNACGNANSSKADLEGHWLSSAHAAPFSSHKPCVCPPNCSWDSLYGPAAVNLLR